MSVRGDATAAALVFAGCFALYLVSLAPATFWLDSSELAAAGFVLGVPHPPGHPSYVMLAKAATLLPLGSVGFRINLLSAMSGALACSMATLLTLTIARSFGLHRRWAPVFAVAAGLLLAGSSALWLQSVRAEVYSPHLAILLVVVWLSVRWSVAERAGDTERWRGPAPLAVASLLLGLLLGNHHYLVFLALPALLLLVLSEPRGRRLLLSRRAGLLLVPGAVGLLVYAYLPVRAAAGPPIDWGSPTTLSRLVDVITARTFQASVTETGDNDVVANMGEELFLLMSQLHPFVVVLGLGGLVMVMLRWSRSLGAFFGLLLIFNLLSTALMRFDVRNPDAHGYLQLSHALVVVLAALLVIRMVEGLHELPGRSRALRVVVALGLVLAGAAGIARQLDAFAGRSELQQLYAPDLIEDAVLREAPPGSLLLASYYSMLFQHWYAQMVEGRRPDVTVVQQSFDAKMHGGVPYTEGLRRRHPRWAPVFDAYLRDRTFPVREVLAAAEREPILLEPELDPPLPPEALTGRGLLFLVAPRRAAPPQSPPALIAEWQDLYEAMAGRGDDMEETEALLLWTHFRAATMYLRQGDGLKARIEQSFAADLNGDSPAVVRLGELISELQFAPPALRARMVEGLRTADFATLVSTRR